MDRATLEALVGQQMGEHGVAGLAVAVVEGSDLIYERAFGVSSEDPAATLAPDSPFMAGSLTKPVFAYAVLLLCQRGLLDLDTPLAELWPEPFSPDPRLARVTARHVLSHSAGFPSWRDGDTLPIETDLGQAFNYSGEGYEYLQCALEALAGEPMAATLGALVLKPRGMAASQLFWNAYDPPRDVAEMAGQRLPEQWWDTSHAAYSLLTTAGDYGRFLLAMLNPAADGLDEASLARMLSPQIAVAAAPGLSWGLGWGLQTLGDEPCFWHWGKIGGREQGYTCYAAGLPGRRRGVVILTNSLNGLDACEPIAQHVLDLPAAHPALAWVRS
ncbi:MAG TPA: serine hydrolase domain-containing protein [Herpetosiphonaceae bacterium]|nr:serine hydrolase domain-containing protein [Herpetosiphonaceae bacterium]